ncbi:type IV pilus biogenesis/stability protein PilW [Iodobacter fluviatilis]|uniref:Predicted methyltransferase (Contains TPR repeat) n=1 Tax=Iodobacter fluviatilis TaxID=537 RepID=A0A377Q6G0_9NEIS|nr:type IV pilus biogenesis/stability protein PilW [Iodobacter fluviatilis]TCU89494.1 type IV pilus assembly protein PilF [Iodobacter fluviatilis]STQ90864.1 Predicted methyltransferase (contains TPR repeat) [Iodobacter fluviatilis]
MKLPVFVMTAALLITSFAGAAEGEEDRASLRTQLGAEYLKRGQYAVAIDEVNKALAVNASYAPAHNVMALIHAELGEDEAARQSFARAVQLSPNDADINHNYGWYLCQKGQYAEGIQFLLATQKNALYSTPDKSLLSAGQCALKGGDEANARIYFERALRIRPDNLAARAKLVEYGMRTKDLALAKRYYSELQRLAPASAELLWLGIQLEHQAGNKELENKLAEQLRKKFPDSQEMARLSSGSYD